MRTFWRILISISILSMLTFSVYAGGAESVDQQTTTSDTARSVTEDESTGSIDNADLNVKVIKKTNNMNTVIYTGPLSEYDNGVWANSNFQGFPFILIFDWDSPNNESVCIVPMNSAEYYMQGITVESFTYPDASMANNGLRYMANKSVVNSFFRLDDALESTEIVDGVEIKTYDVDLLPDSYLESMAGLGSENGNYGDGAVPAPPANYDYNISQINLRDTEDNPVGYLVNGGILQSVTVESNGLEDDVILAVAEYNGYTLTKLSSYSVNLQNDKDVVMTGYALSNITPDTSIKLFVWDAYWGTQPQASPVTLFPENSMDMAINFLYDNVYTEKEWNAGNLLTAQLNARSTMWWPKHMTVYLAIYDSNNKLVDIAKADGTIISDGSYQFISVDMSLPQTLSQGYKVKAFVWDNDCIAPYISSETITSVTSDYHADNISDARLINISTTVEGCINSEDDLDYIKFVPSSTQDYLIQIMSDAQVSGTLYDTNKEIIAPIDYVLTQQTGKLIEQNLLKGKTYYIGLSGTSGSDYSISITPNDKEQDNLIVTGKSIITEGELIPDQSSPNNIAYTLVSSAGAIVATQNGTVSEAGSFNSEIPVNLTTGEYYFMLTQDNIVKRLWSITLLAETKTLDASKDEYCIIPISVTNASALNDVSFAVGYSEDDFELYDACDLTANIENVVGEIPEKFINITAVGSTYVVFESTQTSGSVGNSIINTIKLRAKKDAQINAAICAYQIR